MVRRALSLRRGSTLELEIETGHPSSRSMSFGSGDVDLGAASNITRRGSKTRRDSSASSLPLSRHHQSMRRGSSAVGSTNSAMASIIGSTCRNGSRARTDSSSTAVSNISMGSMDSLNKDISLVSELPEPFNRNMGKEDGVVTGTVAMGKSSMLDNELAVILDDGDDSRNTTDEQA